MLNKLRTGLAIAAACGALAACGDTPGERALIGAGGGVAAATVLDADPLAGAAVGAAANLLYCNRHPGHC